MIYLLMFAISLSLMYLGFKSSSKAIKKILIFLSLWYETAGLTILEAESFNIPCIVSATCAGAEFIEENKNGFLFQTGNVKDLKKQIQKVENKELNNVENNIEKFYDTKYIENLIACYKK